MQADGNPLDTAEDLIAQGRAKEAATLLFDLIEEGRGGLLARFTLARALLAADDAGEAVRVARETAMLNPSVAMAAVSLGEALRAAGTLPTAIGEFQRALRIDPSLDEARFGLGRAWLDAGEPEKALEAFAQIETPYDALRSAIAQAQAAMEQARSDPRYVRHLFDQFSIDYDARMRGQLGYRAPEILREMVSFVLPQQNDLSILDLGCGTGLAGIVFKDITPVLADGQLFGDVIRDMAQRWTGDIDVVAGVEARGFIFGSSLAHELGLGFVPVRKAGKLPGRTVALSYDLEYGSATLEVHDDGFRPGQRVLVVDDVLATGGTADAACRLVEQLGATVVAFETLVELTFLHGRDRLTGRQVHTTVVVSGD